jgi:hypothetical protein
VNNIKKSQLIIFEPLDFRSKDVFNGHKKDINNLVSKLLEYKVECERFYCKGLSIVDYDGNKCDFNLVDIAKGRVFGDQKIMLSPLYRFRLISFLMRRRKPIYYVADSILKTSTHAFSNKPWLFYRLYYAFLVERVVKSSEIIVASNNEALWFSSVGHSIGKITVMPPLPSTKFCPLKDKSTIEYDLFLYHPNGDGVLLAIEILRYLNKITSKLNILITGHNSMFIAKKSGCGGSIKIETKRYVSDLDALICNSKDVIITDIGGSGLCNRSMHVRYLGTRLISTLDGLRGTGLFSDEGVSVYSSAKEAAHFIKQNQTSHINKISSDLTLEMINNNEKIVKKFVDKCVVI